MGLSAGLPRLVALLTALPLAWAAPPFPVVSPFPARPAPGTAPALAFNIKNLQAGPFAAQYNTYGGLSPHSNLNSLYGLVTASNNQFGVRTTSVATSK